MANTILRIKRSTTTATPPNGSLANGEFAYSYNSRTLFMGNTAGTGVVEVGGEIYVEKTNWTIAHANAAYNAANAASGGAVIAAFNQANTARDQANAAYTQGNSAFALAQAAFGQANTASATAVGAFATANLALPVAGGTITGDLVVSGNITVSGQTTYTNTINMMIGDNILTLNADIPPAATPTENAGIEVDRGALPNTSLYWNEASDTWMMTNNTVAMNIASNTDVAAAFSQANAGFSLAQVSYGQANAGFSLAQAAFGTANSGVLVAQGAFLTANNGSNTAVGAFALANSASLIATGAFAKANLAAAWANNADMISSGTLLVNYGGTGRNTLTLNAVLVGNGTSAVQQTATGTDGQVLQVGTSGVPFFGPVDGGLF
jgi:hypothetical protein